MPESSEVIASLYIPVSGKMLLLPNVSVAEIVDYQVPQTDPEASEPGYLGTIEWRGVPVPVISYELANGESTEFPDVGERIALINHISQNDPEGSRTPFFAIVTQGIPRLVKIDESNIKSTESTTGNADVMQVEVNGDPMIIPNLEYLQNIAFQH